MIYCCSYQNQADVEHSRHEKSNLLLIQLRAMRVRKAKCPKFGGGASISGMLTYFEYPLKAFNGKVVSMDDEKGSSKVHGLISPKALEQRTILVQAAQAITFIQKKNKSNLSSSFHHIHSYLLSIHLLACNSLTQLPIK